MLVKDNDMILVKAISKEYGNLKVIDNFNYEFKSNSITCLYGPSGCGKTTLLNIIAKLLSSTGEVILPSNERVSYIFQEDRLLPWKTAIENVEFVLEKKNLDLSKKYLELVGLSNYLNKLPDELSGGMKRRVSIARAFAYSSEVLLMDEPFKGLDKKLKYDIMKDFLKIWNDDKRTVIIVTHDKEEAEFLSGEIIHLDGLPLTIKKVEVNE